MAGSGREWDRPEHVGTRAASVSLAGLFAPSRDQGSRWATAQRVPDPAHGSGEVMRRRVWPLEPSGRARGG